VSILLFAGALYLGSAVKSESVPIRSPLSELPSQINQWEEESANEFDQNTLAALGVDDYINRIYRSPEQKRISLYIGYYVSQRQGDTIHSPLNCLPGSGWNPTAKDTLSVAVRSGSNSDLIENLAGNIQIRKITIQKGLDKQIVLYWYQSHGRVIASEYWGKIYTVIDAIRTNRTDAALVRVIGSVQGMEPDGEKKAEQDAVDFVTGLYPLLGRYLPD
jgi:EpsI family protein